MNNMEAPSDTKLKRTTSINEHVVETRQKSVDAPAIATAHENTPDLEKTNESLQQAEGQSSVGRVRTIKNGKVRRDIILYNKASYMEK